MDIQKVQDLKREQRRKRRLRNKFLSVLTVVLFAVLIAFLGVFIYMKLDEMQKAKTHNDDVSDKLEELTGDETDIPVISEPDVEVVVPETDPFEDALKAMIAEMTVEEKVAKLFFVTPESITGVGTAVKAGDGTKTALEKYPVGGIIYSKKNIKDENQIKEMLAKTKEYANNHIFLGISEESGKNGVASSVLKVDKTDSAETLGKNEDTTATYETGKILSTYLTNLGFNVNFAPVADVKTDENNKLLKTGTFGSDANVVANHVGALVKGMEENGISSCVKEFPGIGSANKKPADGLSITERTLEEMQNAEFVSFKAAISENADFVMISNVAAPQLIGGEYLPSCLSKTVVKDILRQELGYEGIIITAPLNEAAVTEYYTASEATIMAVQAGADMILMPSSFEEAYFALLAEVLEGNISEERIDESLLRIFKVQYANELLE